MKKFSPIFLMIFTAVSVMAQPIFCEPEAKTRVLLIGDSWTWYMNRYNSFNNTFNENDRSDLLATGDVTSFPGARASDWIQPDNLALIDGELAANPDLKVVQIMLGANEMLGGRSLDGWYAGMTAAQELALRQEVAANINTIIDHIKAQNPDLKFLVTFYDYMGFDAAIETALILFPEIADLWNDVLNDLDNPTTERLNTAFREMSASVISDLNGLDNVSFVEYWGLMQNQYGFPADGINPGDIALPGDVTKGAPGESLGFYGMDALHFNQEGYAKVAAYLWDNYYAEQLCITQSEFVAAITDCSTSGGNPSKMIRWMQEHRCK